MKPNKIFKLTLSIFILTVISNQLNAQINFGTNTLSNNSSSTGDGNTGSGSYSFSAGTNNTTSGTKSTAIGQANIASNSLSFAAGYGSEATGGYSMSLGYYSKASGTFSYSFGRFVSTSQANSFVIGTGVNSSNYLANSTTNSLMIGFNSNIPTLVVGASAGVGTFGKVGIGTSSPQTTLDVNGQITMQTGANVGYIPVSDATGKMTWTNPTTITTASLWQSNSSGIYFNTDNVGIGTTNTINAKLSVAGKIRAEEIEVSLSSGWADYVFADDYKLSTLTDLEKFIDQNKHLPNVPSEKEVYDNGVNLGKMDAILLRKIEELTLYVINLNKKIQVLQEENTNLNINN